MDLQGLKDVLSKYGNILIIKEGAVFSLLMKGENLSNIKKLQDIQSTVLDYAGDRYPVIEAFRNDDRYLCMILKPEQKSAIQLIADERQRQVEVEGWTEQHDDSHTDFQMSMAAACYVSENVSKHLENIFKTNQSPLAEFKIYQLKDFKGKPIGWTRGWPWDNKWWKPSTDKIRNLVKAGALIAAEIERLQRMENQKEAQ